MLRDSTSLCASPVHRTLQCDKQAKKGGARLLNNIWEIPSLVTCVQAHIQTLYEDMRDVAAALLSKSLYQSISLSCFNTCLWSEPPGGTSYKVCQCGPGRDTRILLLPRHQGAVAQYTGSHTSNMLVYIFTHC